jgi:hypothetical protein
MTKAKFEDEVRRRGVWRAHALMAGSRALPDSSNLPIFNASSLVDCETSHIPRGGEQLPGTDIGAQTSANEIHRSPVPDVVDQFISSKV